MRWDPMMLTAWHSYCPWSCRATLEILSVPEDRTRCLLSTDSWPPETHNNSTCYSNKVPSCQKKGNPGFKFYKTLENIKVYKKKKKTRKNFEIFTSKKINMKSKHIIQMHTIIILISSLFMVEINIFLQRSMLKHPNEKV